MKRSLGWYLTELFVREFLPPGPKSWEEKRLFWGSASLAMNAVAGQQTILDNTANTFCFNHYDFILTWVANMDPVVVLHVQEGCKIFYLSKGI